MLSPDMSYEAFEVYDHNDDFMSDGNSGDAEDSGSEDEPRRALAFDPNQLSHTVGLPVNGHDYLKMVQEERKRLPEIVTAPTQPKNPRGASNIVEAASFTDENAIVEEDYRENRKNRIQPKLTDLSESSQANNYPDSDTTTSEDIDLESSLVHQADSFQSGTSTAEMRRQIRLKSLGCTPLKIPTPAPPQRPSSPTNNPVFRDQIVANFLEIRAKLDQLRSQMSNKFSDTEERVETNEKNIEKTKSRSRRRAASLLRIMNLGHPPQTRELLRKSQLELHMTLEALADQCESAPIYSTLHADWIYSLITLLYDPIEPDICATLRRIAKLCITRRDAYEKRNSSSSGSDSDAAATSKLVKAIDKEEYYACLLIIGIVRHHFGQADLK